MVKWSEDKNQYYREYYHKNKKRWLETIKKYQQSEKGQKKIKEYKKEYYQKPETKKRRNLYYKKWILEGDNHLKKILYIKLRRRLNSFNKYRRTNPKIIYDNYYKERYGVDFEAIINKLKPIPEDISNLQIDHIIPLSKFDFKKKEDIKKAFSPKNIRLITKEENLRKSNKLVFKVQRRKARYKILLLMI